MGKMSCTSINFLVAFNLLSSPDPHTSYPGAKENKSAGCGDGGSLGEADAVQGLVLTIVACSSDEPQQNRTRIRAGHAGIDQQVLAIGCCYICSAVDEGAARAVLEQLPGERASSHIRGVVVEHKRKGLDRIAGGRSEEQIKCNT